MNRSSVVLFILLIPAFAAAQKKTFTHNQIFRGEFPAIFNDLPSIAGWTDDNHYIEERTGSSGQTLVLVNAATGKALPYQQPTAEPGEPVIADAKNVTFSPDSSYVAYTRKNNLYVMDLASKKETALTTDGSDVILNGYASWVYYEEILGRSSNYRAFWWAPDSRHVAYMRFDDTEVPLFPIYVADGQYGSLEQQRYPKAGAKNPEVRLAIASLDGKTVWADFNEKHDQYFGTPYWTPPGEFLVQWMNRRQDSLVVYRIDATSGKKAEVYTETQPTWITLDNETRFHFLKTKNAFIIESDKDGWQNLYLHGLDGKPINAITSGNFWGTEVLAVDERSGTVYFRARKEHPGRFDVYKVNLNGKGLTRLTSGQYSHDAVKMSPTGKYFITTYSGLNEPPATVLVNNKGKVVRTLGSSKGPEFNDYVLPASRMLTVKSSDGKFDLPMIVTYPVNFDSAKKYPVWISVYGGPDAGTVFDRWKPSGGLAQWWAQEGIVQVTMDNRSSGYFGKAGMNDIHKQLGKWETEDYMACAKWLRSQPWVDTSRVGITGGSFGGYLTCMALTYGADVFTHGIANYSVTDWRLYDTHYTERFMTTPEENEEGYRNTSALTYAGNYKGKLRIVHGSTDDNVHFQNSVQLINVLQDMHKNFELMVYPNQRHGITGSKTAHNFFETIRFIYHHMLKRELPKEFGNP